MPDARELIAARAALEVFPGARLNLGIGIPTLIPRFIPAGVDAWIHSENGFLGMGAEAAGAGLDADLIDAGGRHVTLNPGGSYFDSAASFSLIRGGRLDLCFLGAFEVDAAGNLANWRVPGRITPGIGGAMELAQRVRRVIITMQHTARGRPKLLQRCTLPLTAQRVVARVITDLAVLEPARDGFRLLELAPGVTVADVQAATDAELDVAGVAAWGSSVGEELPG